jgi:hypothetical protein
MAATVPVGFDPAPKALGVTYTFKAGGTILAGMIVGLEASGTSWQVVASTSSTEGPLGVARGRVVEPDVVKHGWGAGFQRAIRGRARGADGDGLAEGGCTSYPPTVFLNLSRNFRILHRNNNNRTSF